MRLLEWPLHCAWVPTYANHTLVLVAHLSLRGASTVCLVPWVSVVWLAIYSVIKDLVHRALIKAGFQAVKEPQGLLRSDGKRPDGITLIPWKAGRSLILDATIVDTLAPSYLPASATQAGAAAGIAEDRKIPKYSALLDTHIFVPVAIKTLGPINDKGLEFIADLGRHLTQVTGEPRESSFFFKSSLHNNTTLQRCGFQWFFRETRN